ncbi:DUF5615 family PIN-like protein [Thermosynechococcaceae cyanobacterium BACA0444]|uniref:DUF5615 family PIN-like protein n=1 Tax=Pseudocalidococcus azoricus BACA0444 TaxID=2918990 RepID=A0AAE4JXV5_9CYAN|nr:DUF5615 family PIN-like protein [Pseudocalidococcus azoricus]MDS3860279.1 DUF5615 family PIN-like protein [Pseudocalidococcus azoricus BACA0444]
MKLKFQADADLNYGIVTGVLRAEPTIDFQTAIMGKLEGLSDFEVLRLAADENRVLISHDQRTMPVHFAKFLMNDQSSGVIIVLQSMPISAAIDGLIQIWQKSKPTDWINRIAYLPL